MTSNSSKILSGFVCLALLAVFGACGKPRLFGKEMSGRPIVKVFQVDPDSAYASAKEALVFQGYDLSKDDSNEKTLETHWQPATSDSHYVDFFERQDRGTVGAYHRLVVKVKPKGNDSEVEIYSLAKSIISNLKSTGIEEEKVFTKIADFTRKHDIEVTNVGIK